MVSKSITVTAKKPQKPAFMKFVITKPENRKLQIKILQHFFEPPERLIEVN